MLKARGFSQKGACVALLHLCLLSAGCHQSTADQQVHHMTQSLSVTADEISSRFRENELAAEAMYAGMNLQVTGTVNRIELGDTDRPVVILAGSTNDGSVRAELAPKFHSKAAMLSEGDTVVFRCQGVTELAQAPLLRNCEF